MSDKAVKLSQAKTLYDDLRERVENVDNQVIVSSTEPQEVSNKLWIDTEEGQEYTIPTYAEFSQLSGAINANVLEENLLRSEMPGTSTTVTTDSDGNPTSIVHTANSETVRTDSFVWGTGTVTETRTLANGKYITITTDLDTLAQTISAVQEVE